MKNANHDQKKESAMRSKNTLIVAALAAFALTGCLGPEEPVDTYDATITVAPNVDGVCKLDPQEFPGSTQELPCSPESPAVFTGKIGSNVITLTPTDLTRWKPQSDTVSLDTGDNGTHEITAEAVSVGSESAVNLRPVIDLLRNARTDDVVGLQILTPDMLQANTDYAANTIDAESHSAAKSALIDKNDEVRLLKNSLQGAIGRASADNPDLAEAQQEVVDATTDIAAATAALEAATTLIRQKEQQAAIDAIVNQPSTGVIRCTGLLEESNGPAAGILFEVIADGGTVVESATTDSTGMVEFTINTGFYEVRASFDAAHVTRSISVEVEEDGVDQLSLILPLVETPVSTGTLCQRDDVVVLGATDLSGAFRVADLSGECSVVVPDAEISLSVQSGTSVSLSGLVLSTVGSGNTVISYVWDDGSGSPQSLSFTAVAP